MTYICYFILWIPLWKIKVMLKSELKRKKLTLLGYCHNWCMFWRRKFHTTLAVLAFTRNKARHTHILITRKQNRLVILKSLRMTVIVPFLMISEFWSMNISGNKVIKSSEDTRWRRWNGDVKCVSVSHLKQKCFLQYIHLTALLLNCLEQLSHLEWRRGCCET